MDLKKVGGKWLQTVTSSKSMNVLGSPSARPEVPARAAAAAAAAVQIAGPPQRESLSSTDAVPKFVKSQKEAEAVEQLEEVYFEPGFDPIRHMLEQIPQEDVDQKYFDSKVGQRMLQLDFITEKLSKQVMEHYEEMVKGMQLVTELDNDLQVSSIICKNGQRHLSLAMHEVSQDLAVSANVKKKQVLLDMLPVIEKIQLSMDLRSELENTVDEGNYARALQICSECMLLLEEFSELTAVKQMNSSIEDWLQGTIEKVDAVLQSVCSNFQLETFVTVLDAYSVMDDVANIGEKVQTFFAQTVISETHRVIKDLINQGEDSQVGLKTSRLPYNDLCLQLPEPKFRQCLSNVLEVLFDIMCSYYQMMTWHQSEKTIQLRENSKGQIQLTVEAEALSHTVRQDTAASIAVALDKGRKTIWELASRRVAALVSSDALCASSPHHFLQSIDWVKKFILAGEAFCGAEAVSLRSKLGKQSEKYFSMFHRQNLEIMRMMLEKESWQQLSASTLQAVNLASLTGDSGSGASRSPSQGTNTTEITPILQRSLSQAGFSTWLSGGNPFVERHTMHSTGPAGEHGNMKGTVNGSPELGVHEDGDDEDEDLLADFIDEDSQLPRRLSADAKVADRQGKGPLDSYTLTGSAVSILRYMDKYAKLLHILQPISADVLKGLCQFFELYFFSIFKIFGQRDAFSGGRSQQDSAALMTTRLRSTLIRISQSLEEQRLKRQVSENNLYASDVASNLRSFMELPAMASEQAGSPVTSSSHLSDINKRVVGAESLMSMAQIMKNSQMRLQIILSQDGLAWIEQFYARTVDVVPDLREHLYQTLARLLLNIGGYADHVASVRWELKDLGLEHNGHVDLLISEYKQYAKRLINAGLSKEVQDLLLDYGLDAIAETLVEGLSRVKRCNNEGRALMSLDLQVLISGLQSFAPMKPRIKLQIVETYIKAFYLPETEYLHWIRTHPEYTRQQVVGLVNLVSSTNNWKRKTRQDLLDKIEAGDI